MNFPFRLVNASFCLVLFLFFAQSSSAVMLHSLIDQKNLAGILMYHNLAKASFLEELNKPDAFGRTPLFRAEFSGFQEIAEFLKENGALLYEKIVYSPVGRASQPPWKKLVAIPEEEEEVEGDR